MSGMDRLGQIRSDYQVMSGNNSLYKVRSG